MTLARYAIPVAACAALFLAACGGGGGGSTTTAQTPTDPPQSPAPTASGDPNRELRAARAAAAVPRFDGVFAGSSTGGVTLSSNVDSRRATTDLAVATFSNGRFLAGVEREGKSDLFIDSNDATSRPTSGGTSE